MSHYDCFQQSIRRSQNVSCSEGTCAREVFVPLIQQVIPTLCDSEANNIYDNWSTRDGAAEFTMADVDLLWDASVDSASGNL